MYIMTNSFGGYESAGYPERGDDYEQMLGRKEEFFGELIFDAERALSAAFEAERGTAPIEGYKVYWVLKDVDKVTNDELLVFRIGELSDLGDGTGEVVQISLPAKTTNVDIDTEISDDALDELMNGSNVEYMLVQDMNTTEPPIRITAENAVQLTHRDAYHTSVAQNIAAKFSQYYPQPMRVVRTY